MNAADAARIQSTQASLARSNFVSQPYLTSSQDKGGKDMGAGGFAARAQSAAANNANTASQQGGKGQASSGQK